MHRIQTFLFVFIFEGKNELIPLIADFHEIWELRCWKILEEDIQRTFSQQSQKASLDSSLHPNIVPKTLFKEREARILVKEATHLLPLYQMKKLSSFYPYKTQWSSKDFMQSSQWAGLDKEISAWKGKLLLSLTDGQDLGSQRQVRSQWVEREWSGAMLLNTVCIGK